MAEEVEQPSRTFPRSVLPAFLVVAVSVVLLGLGLLLWVVNRLVVGPAQRVDAERLAG